MYNTHAIIIAITIQTIAIKLDIIITIVVVFGDADDDDECRDLLLFSTRFSCSFVEKLVLGKFNTS
jgi:hypothetical protein